MNNYYTTDIENYEVINNLNSRGGGTFTIKNAKFMFPPNFRGDKTLRFNEKGDRYFNLALDPDFAKFLKNRGWNVKTYIPKNADGDEDVLYHVKIRVSMVQMGKYAPAVLELFKKNTRKLLTSETAYVLDSAQLDHMDLTIAENVRDNGDGSYTRTGYLNWIRFFMHVDPLDDGYWDSPDHGDDVTYIDDLVPNPPREDD